MDKPSIFGKFIGFELPPEDRKQVLEDLFVFGKENQRPFMIRMAVLIVISTIIATGGLLSNSSAVVIGAMLVAPMMRPVMASAAAVTLGWSRRLYQSLLLLLVMTIGVVVIAAVISSLAPEMINIPEQVMMRTSPTFFDLIIALASGVGGAYVMTRKESSAIPGVAMAVSLLPPLSACGILLVFLEYDLATKAFVLFVTNFLAMTLAGSMTFFIIGISPLKTREKSNATVRNHTLLFLISIIGISVPLTYYSLNHWYGITYKAAKSDELQNWLNENNLKLTDVRLNNKKQILYLNLVGAKQPLSIESLYEVFRKKRAQIGDNRPFNIETVWTQEVNGSWPPPENIPREPKTFTKDKAIKIDSLINVTWQWQQTQYSDSKWIKSDKPSNYTITLNDDNKVSGKIGCNTMSSTYQLSSHLLSVNPLKLTRKKCKNPDLDTMFINDLSRVINFEITEGRLVLQLNNNIGLMYFGKAK